MFITQFFPTSTGVPQSRILGPFSFIIYVYDLLKEMNEYFHKVANWFTFNKLSLNITKTVFNTFFDNYNNSVRFES